MLVGPGAPFGPGGAPMVSGPLAGVPAATLQLWLVTAQAAYNDLMSGAKVVTASYAQGDGSRSVTYSQTSMINLQSYIASLQRALGMCGARRRPMVPWFR